MSMSEFEEQLNNAWEKGFSSLSMQGQNVPADFSDEEIAFAQELDSLFPIDEEEVPSYFVQTLLESEDPRFQAVEHGFEYKTRARVFRRLKLRRRLYHLDRPTLHSLVSVIPARRSLVATAALMLFLLLTVMLTGTSFASGMEMLLRGARTGVLQVHSYPRGVSSASAARLRRDDNDAQSRLSLIDAQLQLHSWQAYMPQVLPNSYTLSNIYLYQAQQQSWADGPFMEFDYSFTSGAPQGTGQLAIREFKLKSDVKVLQVVEDGAARALQIDPNGNAQAIYVDGQWILHDKIFPVWVYGQRSEVIYQKDGIVFWIVGDQRDGMGKDELLKIANSLQTFHVSRHLHMTGEENLNTVTTRDGDVDGPFAGDVLAIFPDDSSAGSYLSLIGPQPSQSDSSSMTSIHAH